MIISDHDGNYMSVQNIRDISRMAQDIMMKIQHGDSMPDWVEDKLSSTRQALADLHRYYSFNHPSEALREAHRRVASRYVCSKLVGDDYRNLSHAKFEIAECLRKLEDAVVNLEARGRSGDYEADASLADTYREAAEAVKIIRNNVSRDLDKAEKWLKKIR